MLIKPLTSLRFVFAFIVFLSHLTFLSTSENNLLQWLYDSIFYEGYIGVSFFFMLSGFILSHAYQDKFLNNTVDSKRFYLARMARIYPLHIFTLLIAIPLELWDLQLNSSQITAGVLQLFLLHAWYPQDAVYFSFNGPAWSLSVEAFLYILFPFIILPSARLSRKKLQGILLTSVLSIVLLMMVVNPSWGYWLFYISPAPRLVDFLIGIAVYQYVNGGNIKWLKKSYMEILAVIALVLFFTFHKWVPGVYRYSAYYWIPMAFILSVFFQQRGMVSRLLSSNLAFWLGQISFSFYLFHQLIYRYTLWWVTSYTIVIDDLLLAVAILIASIAVAALSYRYIEVPSNRWLRKKWH